MRARHLAFHRRTKSKLARLKSDAEHEGAFRVAKRLYAVLLNAEDYTSGTIARILDAPLSKVSEWLRNYGEVYNIGGGKNNSCSILEAFKLIEGFSGKRQRYSYVEQNRIGDHICYYSDLRKMRSHYPDWGISKNLMTIISEIFQGQAERLVKVRP
jgi:hypothetical protein